VLDRQGYRIATLDPRGGPVRTVVALGKKPDTAPEPMVSPDGTRIAYLDSDFRKVKSREEDLRLEGTDLMIVPVKGGKPQRILRVRGGARWPAWDPSGSRLSFTTLRAAGRDDANGRPEAGNAVWEVNADGTCPTKVFGTKRGIAFGSSWETGEGRDAGPIAC
jgi:Tol biopolymer transport system component